MEVENEQPDWLTQVEGVLETLNQGVIVADDCNRIIYANEIFLSMVERTAEEILCHTSADFFPKEDLPALQQHIARGEISGRNRFEFYLPKLGGGRVPVVVSARRIEDPDGREFSVVTFTDITDQKRAEAELREANRQLEERQREIQEELVLAARVQQSLAPKNLVWGGISVETYYQPVRSIGGDFGLVAPSDEDYLNLLVCDVSGHGIGSALVANRIYTETMSQIERGIALAPMMRHLNRFVIQNLGGSVYFFTLAAARLARSGRSLEFAGAGHPPAMVIRPGEAPQLLHSRSLVLGLLEDAVDGEATVEVPLHAGDRLMLYTDGLTDNFNEARDMLGVDGLAEVVREASTLPLTAMKDEILNRIAQFRLGPPADDMSLVLLEIP
ncbi:MAG: SpoIIE family protein phosphatase [Candidatus Acidiferrales bacterium]